jgi:hypothetical protein
MELGSGAEQDRTGREVDRGPTGMELGSGAG